MKKEYAKSLMGKVKQDYSLIAKEFARTRKNPWWEIKFLFDNYLNPEDKVLDLGCGNGRHVPLFRERIVDYFGIDNSPELIEIAKKTYPKVNFQVGDALNLPFSDSFFDKAYSIAVFHHIPSKKFRIRFLKEAKRVLKSKGLLILTVWKVHEFEQLSLLFKYTILKIIGKSKLDWGDVFAPWGKEVERYYHYFSMRELMGLAKKAGFEIIESGVARNEAGSHQNIYIVAQKP